jgi:hypothetical protein
MYKDDLCARLCVLCTRVSGGRQVNHHHSVLRQRFLAAKMKLYMRQKANLVTCRLPV